MSRELSAEQLGIISIETFNALFSKPENFARSAELMELAYWNKVLTLLDSNMEDLDKLPTVCKDGMVDVIKNLHISIVRFMVVSNTTIKYFSIVNKPKEEWTDEEKTINDYLTNTMKLIEDLKNNLEDFKKDNED